MTNYRFIKFCATLILLFSKIIKAENIIENCTNNLNFGSDLSLESNILIEKLNVSADDMYFKKLELSDQNLTELGMQCYTDYNDSLSTQNDITNLKTLESSKSKKSNPTKSKTKPKVSLKKWKATEDSEPLLLPNTPLRHLANKNDSTVISHPKPSSKCSSNGNGV
uniref:Uncharacterized protein n=1 Tax=Trichogramma kaykai TaxID=54128 RepID=A0ABD2W8A9_9HYME